MSKPYQYPEVPVADLPSEGGVYEYRPATAKKKAELVTVSQPDEGRAVEDGSGATLEAVSAAIATASVDPVEVASSVAS